MKTLTLAEYRKKHLGVKQADVARDADCQQSWISQVERGHLPAPWNRDRLLKAYKLQRQPELFERLVMNAAKLKSLRTPATESDPLFATAQSEYRVPESILPLYDAQLREAQQALLMRRAAQ